MFQHKSNKKFNMLKIPVLMPPKLMGRKVNSESSKKTIMEKEYSYSEETLLKFQELVEKGSLKIGRLGDLTKKELDALGATLGLASKKKSGEFLKLDLINLSNIFLGGQGVCHKYIYKRGRTGGWQDMYCSHLFKLGAKLQACQESVSDPSDLVFSLLKLPILMICDDPCTLVSHSLVKNPSVAEPAYGSNRRGCFEDPDDTKDPSSNIDCPDILPVEFREDGHYHDPNSMKNPSQLVHPDARGTSRFVSGTKLQMRRNGTSHKRPSCRYHDVSKTKQGAFIKTMNQEALQNVRKNKTIQADKLRSFETSYLANMLQDYFHNLSKYQEQVSKIRKMANFLCIERHELTHRGVVKFSDEPSAKIPRM